MGERTLRIQLLATIGTSFLGGCQAHLPPLETSPNYPGPQITDIVDHIDCELSAVTRSVQTDNFNASFEERSQIIRVEPGLAHWVTSGMSISDPQGAIAPGTTVLDFKENDGLQVLANLAQGSNVVTLEEDIGLVPANAIVMAEDGDLPSDTTVRTSGTQTLTLNHEATATTQALLTLSWETVTMSKGASKQSSNSQLIFSRYLPPTPDAKSPEFDISRLNDRVKANPELIGLIPYLLKYHFVAAGALSLEVTDTEGLNPSFSYLSPYSSTLGRILTLGFPVLNGTQDRTLNVSYSVDLAALDNRPTRETKLGGRAPPSKPLDISEKCRAPSRSGVTSAAEGIEFSGGIAGDLGLADVIADGLLALNASARENVYGSSGPSDLPSRRSIDLSGEIKHTVTGSPPTDGTNASGTDASISAQILVTPPAAGALTAPIIAMTGIVTLHKKDQQSAEYTANWIGSVVQANNPKAQRRFSLTGNLTAVSPDFVKSDVLKALGYNPSITLSGTLNPDNNISAMSGTITPVAVTKYDYAIEFEAAKPPAPPIVSFAQQQQPGKSASSGSSAQGTSFGSIVDFIFSLGANGGPNWTIKKLKGPTGGGGTGPTGGQFAGVNRMNTDTLTISFVPACQAPADLPTTISSFWQTVPPCDPTGIWQQRSAATAFDRNTSMTITNFSNRLLP